MRRNPITCIWEDVVQRHRIVATIFTPFLVSRLSNEGTSTSAELSVTLRNIGVRDEEQNTLHLIWQPESIPLQPLGVQERPITEWAACGIACAVIALYTELQIRSVASEGDRFDYWVGDASVEYGLEVSGTMTESLDDLAARHREKVRQLRDNPHGVDGYVVVVGFVLKRIIFSFHRFEEVA